MAARAAKAPPSSRRSGPTGRCMSIVSVTARPGAFSSSPSVATALMKDGGGPPNFSWINSSAANWYPTTPPSMS